jgi:hypothetical protein
MSSNELTGRVESFDHASNTFTVAGKSLKVDSTTEVMKDGQTASLTDISEGDQVRASFSGTGDELTAQRIEVMSSSTGTSGMGTTPGTTHDPAGRGGPMGPGTGTGQSDSAGTTSGTGTGSTGGSDTSTSGSPSGTGR